MASLTDSFSSARKADRRAAGGQGGALFTSCDKTETRELVEMGDSCVGASAGSWVLIQQSSSHWEERELLTPWQ